MTLDFPRKPVMQAYGLPKPQASHRPDTWRDRRRLDKAQGKDWHNRWGTSADR